MNHKNARSTSNWSAAAVCKFRPFSIYKTIHFRVQYIRSQAIISTLTSLTKQILISFQIISLYKTEIKADEATLHSHRICVVHPTYLRKNFRMLRLRIPTPPSVAIPRCFSPLLKERRRSRYANAVSLLHWERVIADSHLKTQFLVLLCLLPQPWFPGRAWLTLADLYICCIWRITYNVRAI